MSKKVTINAGYSDKTSENYCSKEYSVSLQMDCNINGTTKEIDDAADKLFMLCKSIVDKQKGVNVDTLLTGAVVSEAPKQITSPDSGRVGTQKLASAKQINYLLLLAKKAGLNDDDIKAIPALYYHKKDFDSLTSVEATKLIDKFKTNTYKKVA